MGGASSLSFTLHPALCCTGRGLATCMPVDTPILTPKLHFHHPPSPTATPRPPIKSTSVPPAWLVPPRRKTLGKRPVGALEADSGLLRLKISEYQTPKELSRSGRGRLHVAMKTVGGLGHTAPWRERGRAREEPSNAQSPVQGSLLPSLVKPTCSVELISLFIIPVVIPKGRC